MLFLLANGPQRLKKVRRPHFGVVFFRVADFLRVTLVSSVVQGNAAALYSSLGFWRIVLFVFLSKKKIDNCVCGSSEVTLTAFQIFRGRGFSARELVNEHFFPPALLTDYRRQSWTGPLTCLALRAPTLDVFLEITKSRKFVIHGFI